VLKLDSILAGEYAENEFRKQFTPSEREAIGRAIEAELGKRQGQRTDLPAIAGKSPWVEGRNWDTTGATSRGDRTSLDIAAKRSGFKSAETYARAKTVVEKGAPEVIAAMDSGDVSISAASALWRRVHPGGSQLPATARRFVLGHGRASQRYAQS